mmetsp:Transcript_35883/g.93204  ORF Transcript_35883/g.93204 Transcript_35883/m.93204 type:complete len:333 (+) Transcript_35883:173-1171(+)
MGQRCTAQDSGAGQAAVHTGPHKQVDIKMESNLLSDVESLFAGAQSLPTLLGTSPGGNDKMATAAAASVQMAAAQQSNFGLPAHISASDVAAFGPKVDVSSILAGVRGTIGQSLEQVNPTQTQTTRVTSSVGVPSTSNATGEDFSDSDEDTSNAPSNKRRKGLPPSGKASQGMTIPKDLNHEDQKKLRRRISNRECARRIRMRRQEQLNTLSMRINTLKGENAKLMVRLTEVMKCWHDIAGENRSLKQQLVSIQNSRGDLANSQIIQELMSSGLNAGQSTHQGPRTKRISHNQAARKAAASAPHAAYHGVSDQLEHHGLPHDSGSQQPPSVQ